MEKSEESLWTKVQHIIAFVLVTGGFIALVFFLFSDPNGNGLVKSQVSLEMGAIFIAAMLIVMVIGVVLIRYSRPYSANPPGLLIAWLGIGLVMFSLTVLVVLCKALVLLSPLPTG